MQHHGACQCWIPAGVELVAKNHMSRLRKNLVITKKLGDLFDGGKSCFSRKALSIMAAYNLHNYGGSDEATEMIIAGVYHALFH